jgi:hypothetical protein
MADIPIQRKDRRRVWPIVLLLIIIAAVATWWFMANSTSTTTTNTAPAPTSLLSAPLHVAFVWEVQHVS